ncbi:NAD(P)/FAD-dependent oxidoreductase [Reichenbachiella sp. MSK19-1]|uniref:NAD(P)/FAD-dependent oxidoreductase n=1 Tax=Reichenbachiella sp. MSK19-1 TaxID=1897631 RepID=UPI000E6C8ED4|nr:FAD-dependent oxidoreductase [Reichenbachiella sp. MSK19-1]RJE72468.1 pyridine nucleotide-disulfide oxidoreductase [Reichenbachiella sp. MSK19-1]
MSTKDKTCLVIGASHAGVNFAFALRKEGWEGRIVLFDKDPVLPYHRPPLSKAYLTSDDPIEKHSLKSPESYEKEHIELCLGVGISSINRDTKTITLDTGETQVYDQLVLATGARPLIPPIPGMDTAHQLYPLRTAHDVQQIKAALGDGKGKRAVIIGGGYIGLEIAASMKKLGAEVTVLEREARVLARVTAPEMSAFFQQLHTEQGVDVLTNKNVVTIATEGADNIVHCSDGSQYPADLIVVGVGIRVNLELAKDAGLEIENGIKVNAQTQTSDTAIYAIGDCSFHHNPLYKRWVRLESVQNAVDQAKVAAAVIAGKQASYNSLPWFWSDQFDVKLQMVGLSEGYDELLIREEEGERKFSAWYFRGDQLLAVDAVNNAKAYVIGTKFIKEDKQVDKGKLIDTDVPLKPADLIKN